MPGFYWMCSYILLIWENSSVDIFTGGATTRRSQAQQSINPLIFFQANSIFPHASIRILNSNFWLDSIKFLIPEYIQTQIIIGISLFRIDVGNVKHMNGCVSLIGQHLGVCAIILPISFLTFHNVTHLICSDNILRTQQLLWRSCLVGKKLKN